VTYTAAALLGVAGALAVDLLILRTRLVTRAVFWATYPVIVAFQLLANGILTGRHIVVYNPGAILGPRIAYAPVEDLLFGFAMILLTLSLWIWTGRRGIQPTPRAGEGSKVLRRVREGTPKAPGSGSDRAAGGGVGQGP
jgi:lycopene cyclase domain-containing protein